MRMKPKLIIFITLFCISLIFNVYLGITSYMKSTYIPDIDDQELLAEMTKMVLDNEKYKEISSNEQIYAIKQSVNRFNVADPSSIFNYEVYVKTNKQSYIFTCKDEICSDIENGGTTYSRYSDEKPILPLNK